MPKFEIVQRDDAVRKTATSGKRGQVLALYLFFIDQLKEGKAGKLQPADGESIQAVRRRLGAAAKISGKQITIKKFGDEVYFWLDTESKKPRKARGTHAKPDAQSNSVSSSDGHNGYRREAGINTR